MLTYTPSGISPRFTCDAQYFPDIAVALNSVGHVVIENVLDAQTLDICNHYTTQLFTRMDNDYQAGLFTEGQIYAYLGNTTSFMSDTKGSQHFEHFIDMIERSSILDLSTFLLKGDVAALHGPMLRRVTSDKMLRFVGLHTDCQVKEYAEQAYKNQDSYTCWMPLCDIHETTPRLMLLNKTLSRLVHPLSPLVNHPTEAPILRHDGKEMDISCLLLPGPQKVLTPEETIQFNQKYHERLHQFISAFGNEIYAPTLKMNSVIMFQRGIYHGSFCHAGLQGTRHSIDIRFVGDFNKSVPYINKERATIFKRYLRQVYDPFLVKEGDPFSPLQNQFNQLQQQQITQQQQLAHLTQMIQGLLDKKTFKNHPIVVQLKNILRPVVKPILKRIFPKRYLPNN